MTEDTLSPFDPLNGTPVTIVFGSFNYRNIVARWIDYATSSCDHWRIVCLDKELVVWLNEMGHGANAVYFYDLFPDMDQRDFNNLKNEPTKRNNMIFRVLRPKLWCILADSGRDFIHSDADAFWLQDPRPWLMQHTEFDLLISQGTKKPYAHFQRHRFVLCAGFFFCRSNVRTQNYFRKVKIANKIDQVPMNMLLLKDPEARWQIHQPTLWSNTTDSSYNKLPAWGSILIRGIWRLNPLWLRNLEQRLASHKELSVYRIVSTCLYISTKIMKGKFSNELTVGVIPMHLVSRINLVPSTSPLVVHLGKQQQTYSLWEKEILAKRWD